jgi:regulatory protein
MDPDQGCNDLPVDPGAIRLAAMDLLARREHSRRELRQKLHKRFPHHDLIEEQLDRLADENLQSDSRYAESFLRQRVNRGYGPVRVRQEMRRKGIADPDIHAAMASVDVDWFHQAEQAWQRKFGATPAADIREKARRDRFMRYRGFDGEHYRHLLGE